MVEVVVPYAPGGGTDNLMRMITGIMEENKWSPQPINVNNRPGIRYPESMMASLRSWLP